VEDKLIHTNINPKLGVQKWISGYEINEFYVVLSLCAYKTALRGCLDQAACQPGNDSAPGDQNGMPGNRAWQGSLAWGHNQSDPRFVKLL
jgi:hypothetical protein